MYIGAVIGSWIAIILFGQKLAIGLSGAFLGALVSLIISLLNDND